MADPRRAALCASISTTATAAVFFLTGVVTLRLPLYLPLSHRWILGTVASEPELSMDYFGRSLLALSAGGLAALLLLLSTRRRQAAPAIPPTTKALRLGLAYAITAFVLCTSLFAYKLYGREPVPSELPPDPTLPISRRSEPTADASQPPVLPQAAADLSPSALMRADVVGNTASNRSGSLGKKGLR